MLSSSGAGSPMRLGDMPPASSSFINARVVIFALLMAVSWGLWWISLPGYRGDVLTWLLFSGFGLLMGWSWVLYRRERLLAWVCWLSVWAMIYFGLTLPWR